MGMFVPPLSVIIYQIHVKRVAVLKAKNNPPVAGYGHAPTAFQAASQRVKPVPGQAEIARVVRLIEMRQRVADAPDLIGPHTARIVALEQAFQSPVTKRPYHQDTVPRIGTSVNRFVFLQRRGGTTVTWVKKLTTLWNRGADPSPDCSTGIEGLPGSPASFQLSAG
jgi:hypothetical protein